MTFTQENTSGYSEAELDAMNAEWQRIVEAEGLDPDTDEYYAREKAHADAVSSRRDDGEADDS